MANRPTPLATVRKGWHTRVVKPGRGPGSYTRKPRNAGQEG